MSGLTSRKPKFEKTPVERKTLRLSDAKKQPPPDEETSYQNELRLAIYDGISTDDVTELVKNVVTKAKAGDSQALKIVFDYLLSGKRSPTQAIVQQTHVSVEDAAREARRNGVQLPPPVYDDNDAIYPAKPTIDDDEPDLQRGLRDSD